jgi:hypothetical protein
MNRPSARVLERQVGVRAQTTLHRSAAISVTKGMNKRTYLLVTAVLVAVAAAPFALAAGEGGSVRGGARNPSSNSSLAYTRETQLIANNSTYGTRQSNKSDNGGGAIYGCRSGAGGSPKGNEPCVRAVDLAKGLAFEFQTGGDLTGTITAAGGGDGVKPFTTNATGVATGLNADRVDNMNAEDIIKAAQSPTQVADPFVRVASNGSVAASRGLAASNPVVRNGEGDHTVTFDGDKSTCAFTTALESADPGTITIETKVAADKKSTSVEVRTAKFAAVPAPGTGVSLTSTDLAFHLAASC